MNLKCTILVKEASLQRLHTYDSIYAPFWKGKIIGMERKSVAARYWDREGLTTKGQLKRIFSDDRTILYPVRSGSYNPFCLC